MMWATLSDNVGQVGCLFGSYVISPRAFACAFGLPDGLGFHTVPDRERVRHIGIDDALQPPQVTPKGCLFGRIRDVELASHSIEAIVAVSRVGCPWRVGDLAAADEA